MKPLFLRFLSLWPPFLAAGIRVRRTESGYDVSMNLHWYNRNFVGTHYGGSLYSMADPFYMLILIEALGKGYTVWDKAATIRFRRPGRGRVHASFEITDDEVAEIRRRADAGEVIEPTFTGRVVDDEGELVAEIEKLLHVRRRSSSSEG